MVLKYEYMYQKTRLLKVKHRLEARFTSINNGMSNLAKLYGKESYFYFEDCVKHSSTHVIMCFKCIHVPLNFGFYTWQLAIRSEMKNNSLGNTPNGK